MRGLFLSARYPQPPCTGGVVNILISKGADVQGRTDIFTEAVSHAVVEGAYGAIVAAIVNRGQHRCQYSWYQSYLCGCLRKTSLRGSILTRARL